MTIASSQPKVNSARNVQRRWCPTSKVDLWAFFLGPSLLRHTLKNLKRISVDQYFCTVQLLGLSAVHVINIYKLRSLLANAGSFRRTRYQLRDNERLKTVIEARTFAVLVP